MLSKKTPILDNKLDKKQNIVIWNQQARRIYIWKLQTTKPCYYMYKKKDKF